MAMAMAMTQPAFSINKDSSGEKPVTSQLKFLVQGLEKEPYQLVFTRTYDDEQRPQLICECECIAAAHGDLCNHRLRILEGNTDCIVSNNQDQVAMVQQWLSGTDLEKAIAQLVDAEKLIDYAEQQLDAAKNQLGEMMAGAIQ